MSRHIVRATCYDRKGRVISTAVNNYRRTHPIQKHFAQLSGFPEREYLHAEIAALLRCRSVRPYKIFVERYYKDGKPAIAKPCPICSLACKSWGVSVISYTC